MELPPEIWAHIVSFCIDTRLVRNNTFLSLFNTCVRLRALVRADRRAWIITRANILRSLLSSLRNRKDITRQTYARTDALLKLAGFRANDIEDERIEVFSSDITGKTVTISGFCPYTCGRFAYKFGPKGANLCSCRLAFIKFSQWHCIFEPYKSFEYKGIFLRSFILHEHVVIFINDATHSIVIQQKPTRESA